MKKITLITTLLFSSIIYANDENVSFFSSEPSSSSNNISTVDDPDDPNVAPINESAYILLIIAVGAGFIFYRNKAIKVIR